MGITTNEILIPKRLFKAKAEKELEFDTPLSDFCPDIARLIRVDCTPFAENCIIDGDKAIVNGKAVYDVLYETDYKNRLKYCSFSQEFSQSVPLPRSNASDASAYCSVKCERIGCKLLSPRRLIIKSTLGMNFGIEGEYAVKAVAVNEDSETFFRKKTIGFEGKTAMLEENYRFGDSLSLTQNEKSIGEIVFGNITLQEPQISLSPGRAEIKSMASVHALCEDESNEGSYYMAIKTLPVSIDFRNDAIEDFKRISVELEPTEAEFKPELDQYGENRMIKTDFGVKMKMKINEPKAYTVAEDMFEKDYDSVLVSGSATVPHMFSHTDTGFSVESKLSEMLPKPEALLDSTVQENGAVAERAEDGITLSGSFTVTLLTDTAEGIHSFDQSVPYTQFLPMEMPEGEASVNAEIYPIEVIATLHSDGTATVRIIAGVHVSVHTEQEETFISEVTKRVPREAVTEQSALIYCFPEKGEDLWSIAKSYRTDPESISDANPESFDESGRTRENSKPILIKA